MKELIWLIIILAILYVVDGVFTVLIILKMKKDYKNPEDSEMNYHRWFFKKFGVVKGALISFPIGLCVFIIALIALYSYEPKISFILLGMVITTAYINLNGYILYAPLKPKRKEDA